MHHLRHMKSTLNKPFAENLFAQIGNMPIGHYVIGSVYHPFRLDDNFLHKTKPTFGFKKF